MYQLHCFHLFLCSSKSFNIPSECMLQRHCFKFFSAVSIRLNYRVASECMLQRHCFQQVFYSSKSFQIPSLCMFKRHYFQKVFYSSKQFQIVSECILQRNYIHFFSAVSNRFKYHQNAYFRDIAPGSYTSCTSDLIIWYKICALL